MRRRSGTSGLGMIAVAGSLYGTGGTPTRPMPSLPRRVAPVGPVEPVRVPPEPVPKVAPEPVPGVAPEPVGSGAPGMLAAPAWPPPSAALSVAIGADGPAGGSRPQTMQ